MADYEELAAETKERLDRAEGYMLDAEFREEFETRQIRYLQAMCELQILATKQNAAILDLLSKQQL